MEPTYSLTTQDFSYTLISHLLQNKSSIVFFFVLFFFSSNDLFYFVCYLYSYFRLHQRRRRRKGCMQAHRCLPHQLRRYLQHHWLSLDTGPAEGSWVEFSLHTLSLSLTAWRLFLCLTGFTQMEDFMTT